MSLIQIESIESPMDDPGVAISFARLLARAEAMGLLAGPAIRALDEEVLGRVLRRLGTAGIARNAAARLPAATARPGGIKALLDETHQTLEGSPLPAREWTAMTEVLGVELLARLLHIGTSSLRRYARGERQTPDEVAERLHALALVVADLAGGYNEIGIRRWFFRARTALEGRAPAQLLRAGWSPDHEGPRRVAALASSLLGSPAT